MNDLIDSIFSMTMDVYRQVDTQNINTGAVERSWQYYKTVDCHATGLIANSTTSRGSDKVVMGIKYELFEFIQIRTGEKITLREKITNICDSNGTVVWEEVNYPESTPTVFEVVGITPILDPFSEIIAYNTVARRSENQTIG